MERPASDAVQSLAATAVRGWSVKRPHSRRSGLSALPKTHGGPEEPGTPVPSRILAPERQEGAIYQWERDRSLEKAPLLGPDVQELLKG